MSSTCPACSALLEEGVLRCRFCGADARGAAPAGDVGRTLSVVDAAPDAARVAELLDELGLVAPPGFLDWLKHAPPERKDRFFAILAELRSLARRPQ